MLIILLVMFILALLVGFVLFLTVLLGGAVSVWSLWLIYRSRRGTVSSGTKDEMIVLLLGLLALVLCSPILYVVALWVWQTVG